MRQALADGRALPVARSRSIDRPLYEASSLRFIGDAQYYTNHHAVALATYEQAVAVIERARRIHPAAKLFDRSAYYYYEIASTLSALGRPGEALPWIERGAAVIAALRTFDDSARTRHVENIVTLQHAEILGALPYAGRRQGPLGAASRERRSGRL